MVPSVYFCFCCPCLRRQIQKTLKRPVSKSILPMFSSTSFMPSGLTFKSLINFECIFVYGVRKCSNLIVLHGAVQFSQHHLLKRLSSLLYILASLVVDWPYVLVYFYVLYPVSFLWSMCLFLHQFHTVLITELCSIVWSQGAWFLQLHFSFSRLLWLFRVFCVSIQIVKFLF